MLRAITLPSVLGLLLVACGGAKETPANDAARGKTDAATAGGVGAPPVVGTPRGPQGTDNPLPGPPEVKNAEKGDRNSDLGAIVGTDKEKASEENKAEAATTKP